MIVELGPPEPRDSLRSWLLPVGLATLLLIALGAATPPSPHVEPIALPEAPRPAVLAAPRAAPYELTLPDTVGERISRGAGGVTGRPSAVVLEFQETWWQFRLEDGRDVRLARAPRGDGFILAPQTREVRVRQVGAKGFTTRAGSAVVWSESGSTYQLSSRTLSLDELLRVADAFVRDGP